MQNEVICMASAWQISRVTKIFSDLRASVSSMSAQRSPRVGWLACPDPDITGRSSPGIAKRPSLAALIQSQRCIERGHGVAPRRQSPHHGPRASATIRPFSRACEYVRLITRFLNRRSPVRVGPGPPYKNSNNRLLVTKSGIRQPRMPAKGARQGAREVGWGRSG